VNEDDVLNMVDDYNEDEAGYMPED
jgi:hypothetical protein